MANIFPYFISLLRTNVYFFPEEIFELSEFVKLSLDTVTRDSKPNIYDGTCVYTYVHIHIYKVTRVVQ